VKFPKSARLLTRRDFQKVSKEGGRRVGKLLCADVREADAPKLGISASTRYGSALERNRFKRLVRESFRKSMSSIPPLEINIVPRQHAKGASQGEIFDELMRLLKNHAK